MTASFAAHTPEMVYSYFGERLRPRIVERFEPGAGWRRMGYNAVLSESKVRKLRAAGVTHVALLAPSGRRADFTVAELLAAYRRDRRAFAPKVARA